MNLSDSEKAEIKALLDSGEPLPDKYRWKLFAQPRETELIWPGKTSEVTNAILPFQVIEHIDEPRAEAPAAMDDLFAADTKSGRQTGGWANKLIWGDNKLVLSSLRGGPLRRQIEEAGGLKLVYIDPPFDVGADFSFNVEVGDNENYAKEPSVIEDIAYRDTWGRGADSYVSMVYERVRLIKDLLSVDGSIYIHVGSNVSSYVKLILEDLFGSGNVLTHISWQRATAHGNAGIRHAIVTDHIIFARNGDRHIWNKIHQPYDESYIKSHYSSVEDTSGRRYTLRDLTASMSRASSSQIYEWKGVRPVPTRCWAYTKENMDALYEQGKIVLTSGRMPRMKLYLDEMPGVPISDLWTDINPLNSQAKEDTGYETQKPESLLERVISTSSNPGDLIADFFSGSGTTLAVAEKLGRKWIGCDLGRFAIHTCRKRLIGVQRELKRDHKPYRSFEILNLGKYERQFFVGIDPTLPEDQRRTLSAQKEDQFIDLILTAYRAERVTQSPPFHGRKGSSFIVIGPIDAPVTESLVNEAVEAARALSVTQVDILGFEFEMGVIPRVIEEARAKGVRIAVRYIPKDVFDKRAIEKNQVTFYDVAYLDVSTKAKGRVATVTLADFAVSYRQEDADALAGDMKPGGSKVTIDGGQVVKISKDKQGVITREVLTKKWEDWIDYWSVDFDYHSKQEIITVTAPDATGRMVDRQQWTGGYIFENEWQSFRTRRDRSLELTSAPHEYPDKGRYHVAVKVIDIFGNDTTKVVEIKI